MTDFARLRRTMVESQIQTNDITDRRILRAMLEVPRERFVAPAYASLAYMDEALPASGAAPGRLARQLAAPLVVAKLLQLAALDRNDVVLEIGSASGYATALIARLCLTVTGVESDPALVAAARGLLKELGAANAVLVEGSLAEGRAADGPYDAIVVSGAVPEVPRQLASQLKQTGRLVAIVGEGSYGRLTVFERAGDGMSSRPVQNLPAPSLPGFARKAEFVL